MNETSEGVAETLEAQQQLMSTHLVERAIIPAIYEVLDGVDRQTSSDVWWRTGYDLAYGDIAMDNRDLYEAIEQAAVPFEDSRLDRLFRVALCEAVGLDEPEIPGKVWPGGPKIWPGLVWSGKLAPQNIREWNNPEEVASRVSLGYQTRIERLLGRALDKIVDCPDGSDPMPVRTKDGLWDVSMNTSPSHVGWGGKDGR